MIVIKYEFVVFLLSFSIKVSIKPINTGGVVEDSTQIIHIIFYLDDTIAL